MSSVFGVIWNDSNDPLEILYGGLINWALTYIQKAIFMWPDEGNIWITWRRVGDIFLNCYDYCSAKNIFSICLSKVMEVWIFSFSFTFTAKFVLQTVVWQDDLVCTLWPSSQPTHSSVKPSMLNFLQLKPEDKLSLFLHKGIYHMNKLLMRQFACCRVATPRPLPLPRFAFSPPFSASSFPFCLSAASPQPRPADMKPSLKWITTLSNQLVLMYSSRFYECSFWSIFLSELCVVILCCQNPAASWPVPATPACCPACLAIVASCVASCTVRPVFRFAWSSVHVVIVDGGEGGAGEHGGGEVGHHGGQGQPGQPCCWEVQPGKALPHEPGNHEVLEEWHAHEGSSLGKA